jgi:uncharacterized membrane protein
MDIVARAKAIIMTPKTEWQTIENETDDTASLFRNYVAYLAAIPAICGFIGMSVIGFSVPVLGTIRIGFFAGLASAIIRYVLTFVMLYVLAQVTDALAPTFAARKDYAQAIKLVVYAFTPAWLAGVFSLIPGLRGLSIIGLYSLYLFWLGAPVLMKAPEDKSLPYTGAVVVCGVVAYVVISTIAGIFAHPY